MINSRAPRTREELERERGERGEIDGLRCVALRLFYGYNQHLE